MAAELYLARVSSADGPLWVLFDKERVMYSKPKESRFALLARWNYPHGTAQVTTRFKGTARPSELAMTIGSIRRPKESES